MYCDTKSTFKNYQRGLGTMENGLVCLFVTLVKLLVCAVSLCAVYVIGKKGYNC